MTTTPAMPDRFTKKPVTVEAFQMTEARRMDNRDWPEWLHQAWNKEEGQPGALFRQNLDAPLPDLLCIQTLEGVHLVNWGDWIIRGVKGELYPCKPDIFEMTYDRAALQSAQPAEVSDAAAWELWLRVCAESDNLSTRVMIANFARAILALRPQAAPMTWELLTDERIKSEDFNGMYWLALKNGTVTTGYYQWRQGHNPYGFNTEEQGRISASDVSHITPLTEPAHPGITAQGAQGEQR